MKKIIILVLGLLIISLSGCDIYYDKTKREMELIEIEVRDNDGNIVEGEYKNARDLSDGNDNYYITKTLINSAAPSINYYVFKAEEGKTYEVTFIFVSKKNYNLNNITVLPGKENGNNQEEVEVTDIVRIDGKFRATYIIENATPDKLLHVVTKWSGKSHEGRFGTKGSNTYIKGVYLDFESTSL